MAIAEEILEISGATLFIAAHLLHIRFEFGGGVQLRLEASGDGSANRFDLAGVPVDAGNGRALPLG